MTMSSEGGGTCRETNGGRGLGCEDPCFRGRAIGSSGDHCSIGSTVDG